jgi:hypothetical protein
MGTCVDLFKLIKSPPPVPVTISIEMELRSTRFLLNSHSKARAIKMSFLPGLAGLD